MREAVGIGVWIALSIWTASSWAFTITGRVVDNKALPVQGAEVVVCEQYRIHGFEQGTKMVSPVVRTDAQGRFALEADVTTQRDACVIARKPGLAYGWQRVNSSLRTLSGKHILLVLEPACTMTGQVVDLEGRPVAGAEVQAMPTNTWGFGWGTRPSIDGPTQWLTVTTDAQGTFRFEQLSADASAGLWVRAPGGGSRYAFPSPEWKSYKYEVWHPDIRLVLPWEGTVRGRVVDAQGRPVGGVDLMVRSAQGEEITSRNPVLSPSLRAASAPGDKGAGGTSQYVVRRTTSDRTGAFAFAGLPEGPHRIDVLPPEQGPALWTALESRVSVKAGQVAETTIRVDKGGVLEVTVLDARTRRPVADAQLSAGGQLRNHGQFATSDASGVARIRVPADTYRLAVVAGPLSQWQGMVPVTDGRTVRCEAPLTIFPRVTGRVLDPQGRPAANTVVTVHPFGDHLPTDAAGRFELGYDPRFGTKRKFVVARDPESGRAAAAMMDGSFRPVDLTLGPAWTLTGRISDPNGTAIPAARLSLTLEIDYCLSDTGVDVLSDPQGRFEMKAIPRLPRYPHRYLQYELTLNAAGYGPINFLRIFPYGPAGASVDLGTIRLPPATVSVSGVVVDAQGRPAARVPVFVGDERAHDQPPKDTRTNERGEFTFTRLCQGPVRFQANAGNSPGGATFLRTRLPARDVRIVLGKGLPQDPESSTPPLVLTQPIDLGSYLPHDLTEGRPVLLCFIDIRQPSSRQCVAELVGKADALEAKGIITIARQASEGTRELYAQLDAHCTAFPWHLAGGDFAARKAAWGIKSLPWLILTDKKHVVAAGGFGLDELDKRIGEALAK
ncbi:MAG: carboxypeptidase-like regulatory domain-containing protein [Planctomycetes bacterium]|nr:carboxypeptidase-like regulatory domain-containing protein [Planctomycetota bacterium]